MNAQEWKDVAEAVESIVTALALLVGGGWALARFWREREGAPRIQFDTSARFWGKKSDAWMVEVIATLENRGRIRQKIEKFTFSLTYLTDGDLSADRVEAPFPNACGGGSWIPRDWLYTFIEPGVMQSYRIIAAVPASARYLHIASRFDYVGTNEFHESDWVGVVPPSSQMAA